MWPMGNTDAKLSDVEWVRGVREGDPAVVSALREFLCTRLQIALANRAGQSDYEDFAHDALTRIEDALESYRGDSRFTTWAAAIAIRVAFTELRRKRWGNRSLEDLVDRGRTWPDATAETASAQTIRKELVAALNEGMKTVLTDRQRTVLLGELHHTPTAVLCDELGVSRGALYKIHHDARKKLRTYLEKMGFHAEDLREILKETSSNG